MTQVNERYSEAEDLEALESDPDLALRPSTLSALASFLDEHRATTTRESLLSLSFQSHPESSMGTAKETLQLIPSPPDCPWREEPLVIRDISVKSFKAAFKENWQLSQFWYSQDTAERLARTLGNICKASDRVAFVCCPTMYVAFTETRAVVKELVLLEHDTRFSILAGANFVHYDLEQALSFPRAESLQGSIDIVVADPPFHSEISQRKIASTITHIIRPGGRLVVLTGLTLSSLINTIYSPPLPQLRRRDIEIVHDGIGRLETPYGCWVGGGEEDKNDCFGNILEENNEGRWASC